MSKYRRQHSSDNTSKGIYWILFAGALAFGIYKAVVFIRNVNKLHDIEMEEKNYNNPGYYIITIDSAGKKDTQWIQDRIENYDAAADTIKKPPQKDSFK